MAAEKGSAFLLKIGDGESPVGYSTIAGLRTTQLSVNGEPVAITSKDSGGWRQLLSGAGVFTGSDAETRIKNHALGGIIDAYELSFEGGEKMQGDFLVTRLDYSGDYNGERSYTLSLESSGAVVNV